jgi:hypothetical protein
MPETLSWSIPHNLHIGGYTDKPEVAPAAVRAVH